MWIYRGCAYIGGDYRGDDCIHFFTEDNEYYSDYDSEEDEENEKGVD